MTTPKRQIYQVIGRLRTFFQERNLGTFCLFLLFATILWFGHSLNSVRERTLNIPVEYIGVSDDILFSEPLPSTIQIVIRDQGKRLRTYKQIGFPTIQFDLSGQLHSETGTITIYSEQIRQRVTDQLQGTAKLQRILPETITRDFRKQRHKKVKVLFPGHIQPATQYIITKGPIVTPQELTVYASKEVLDTLKYVYTETQTFRDIKDSLSVKLPLNMPEGVRAGLSSVTMSACVEQYTEKSFSLPIVAQDVPHGLHLRMFPAIAEVVVKVGISHFDEVKAEDLAVYCPFPKAESSLLPIRVVTANPYVLGYRISPQEVEYIVERN